MLICRTGKNPTSWFPKMNDKKIVHVIGAMIAGGAEKFVCELVLELKKNGNNVSLILLSNRMDDAGISLRKRLEENNIEIYSPKSEKVRLNTLFWYRKIIKFLNPVLIHLHTPNTELVHYLACKTLNKEFTLYRTIHNTNLPNSYLMKRAMQKNIANMSIGCGTAVFEKHNIAGSKICIPNGVEFSWPIQTQKEKNSSRELLGINKEKKVFVAIGSMSGNSLSTAQKGHDVLIKAWRQSEMSSRNAVIYLIGDGNLRKELQEMTNNLNTIEFLGIRNDVKDWLLAADYFVMPSRFEGLPIAGIEAVGTGLATIFTNIEPLKEIMPPVCYRSDVDDVDGLAKNLVLATKSTPDGNIDFTYNFRKRYSMNAVAKSYASEYAKL